MAKQKIISKIFRLNYFLIKNDLILNDFDLNSALARYFQNANATIKMSRRPDASLHSLPHAPLA
jgi:hypothetical protein